MKLTLICVGRLKEDAERQIVARYMERFQVMGAPLGLGPLTIVELLEARDSTAKKRKAVEATEIRKKIANGAHVIALDERGRSLNSAEFAETLALARDNGARAAEFVIGGPDGLDPDFVSNAHLTLSLGRLILPHGLARVVLVEQIYRAATILAGHPYHRA